MLNVLNLMQRIAESDEAEAERRGEPHGPHVVEAAEQDDRPMAKLFDCGFGGALRLQGDGMLREQAYDFAVADDIAH